MSEALKSNTTLIELCLNGENKRTNTQKTSISNSLFSILITSTDNKIRDKGAKSLSKALKSNTTLTELGLCCEKQKKTHKRHPSTILFFFILFTSTDNNIGKTGVKSLSKVLKLNTTLTKLTLDGEHKRKKTHKRHPSAIHSLMCTKP